MLLLFLFIWIGCLGVVGLISLVTLIQAEVITLPGTPQRRVAEARADSKIAEFEAEREEAKLRTLQIKFAQDAERVRIDAVMDQMIDAVKQKQLTGGNQ